LYTYYPQLFFFIHNFYLLIIASLGIDLAVGIALSDREG
jgi:hypothetical protein